MGKAVDFEFVRGQPCPVCGKKHNYEPCWRHRRMWKTRCPLGGCGQCTKCICCGPSMGSGRACRNHGGAVSGGFAHPNYKHGNRSLYLKHLPKNLRNHFEEIAEDSDLTELREELRLQMSMIMDAARCMGEVSAPPWGKVVERLNDCKIAKRKKNPAEFEKAFAAMELLIRTGAEAAASVDEKKAEIRGLIQEKTRTATAEAARLHDLQGFVKLETAMWTHRAIFDGIRSAVADSAFRGMTTNEQLRAIFGRIVQYMPPPSQVVKGRPLIEVLDESNGV